MRQQLLHRRVSLQCAAQESSNIDTTSFQDSANLRRFMKEYKSCIDTNSPTPLVLVSQNAKQLLTELLITEPEKKGDGIVNILQKTLYPVHMLPVEIATDLDTTIRAIQLQIVLRLQFWACIGPTFAKHYKKAFKGLRRKKSAKAKKSKEANELLYNDIFDLLSVAAMKLPESWPFSQFLQSCLDKTFVSQRGSKLPKDVYAAIYNKFEIRNPAIAEQEEYVPFLVKPKQPQTKQNNVSQPSLTNPTRAADENEHPEAPLGSKPQEGKEKGTTKSECTNNDSKPSLLPKSVKLVAPVQRKRNSLLSSGLGSNRSQFVGSHFNTNLSNMDVLFREVKTQAKQPIRKRKASSKLEPLSGSNKKKSTNSARPKPKSTCFQVAETKTKKVVQETPMPRKKTQSARQVVFAARAALRRRNA